MKLLYLIVAGLMVISWAGPLPAGDGGCITVRDDDSDTCVRLYQDCELEGLLDFGILENALECLDVLEFNNENLLTIIDFTKASTEKRLFVIDLESRQLLFHTLVAHGKNTGFDIAERFSNTSQSLQSSLGFFTTAEPYFGKHGISLRLDGLEKGINDNARARAIVIHGATYVSEGFIDDFGRLGRSWGCPALPVDLAQEIIDLIKDGSCLYIYSDDENYLESSGLSN